MLENIPLAVAKKLKIKYN